MSQKNKTHRGRNTKAALLPKQPRKDKALPKQASTGLLQGPRTAQKHGNRLRAQGQSGGEQEDEETALREPAEKRAGPPCSSAPGRSHWEAQEPAAPGAPPVSPGHCPRSSATELLLGLTT